MGCVMSFHCLAPASAIIEDCNQLQIQVITGQMRNVINNPVRVPPYYAKHWGHEGVFACVDKARLPSESFQGFLSELISGILDEEIQFELAP